MPPGKYKLECWGARGGNARGRTVSDGGSYSNIQNAKGGSGGYSTGVLKLKENTTLYLYVGGYGGFGNYDSAGAGGFNGGSKGDNDNSGGSGYSYYYGGGGGGGATDIRIGTDSLYARVIVAGGGGGGSTNPRVGDGSAINGTSGGGIEGCSICHRWKSLY